MSTDRTLHAVAIVADACKQALADNPTPNGPTFDVYEQAVTAEQERRSLPVLPAPVWRDVAVFLGARLAGHERRAAVDLEHAWSKVTHAVDEYRRQLTEQADWRERHPEAIAPLPGQESLL